MMTRTNGVGPDAPGLSRYSINQQSLRNAPFSAQLAAIAASGAAGVGILQSLVPPDLSGVDAARRITNAGLTATLCIPSVSFLMPLYEYSRAARARVSLDGIGTRDEGPAFSLERQVQKIIDGLRWLAPLEPAGVIVLTGAQGDRSAAEAWEMAAEGLGRVDDEARKLGLSLALEPVNPRYAADFSILDTIDTTLALIDDVGTDNVGVLIDVFHVWETNDLFGQIERAAGRISGVHVVDIAETPRSCLDRLIPGDGVTDLTGLIRALEGTGFRGWYDCEVITDLNFADSAAVSHLPADDIARRCVDGFLAARNTAGSNV